MSDYLKQLQTFDINSLPDLDEVVLGALDLFSSINVPQINFQHWQKSLVLGSVNAYQAARIIFSNKPAYFGNESNYQSLLEHPENYNSVVILSASGGKHAVEMSELAQKSNLDTYLITSKQDSLAGEYIPLEKQIIFPTNREPYTYNVSTYLGPILASTGEFPAALKDFLETDLNDNLNVDFSNYTAFTLIVPARFAYVVAMLRTKFEELFGPMVVGRVFSEEEIKHAKTVVKSKKELFIHLGTSKQDYGYSENNLYLPLPETIEYAGMIAVGYYVIGKIQKALPAYFKDSIVAYTKEISDIFKQEIKPIVE